MDYNSCFIYVSYIISDTIELGGGGGVTDSEVPLLKT